MSSKKRLSKKSIELRRNSKLKRKSSGSPNRDLLINRNSITLVDNLALPVRVPSGNLSIPESVSTRSRDIKEYDLGIDNLLDIEEKREKNKKDKMFFEEINKQMNKSKIEKLSKENAELQQRVAELEAQLTALEVKCPPAIHGRASDLAASKIVELSKKIRELTAELEVTKLRARTAENGGKHMSRKNSSDSAENKQDENKKCQEIKELTEKLNSTNVKFYEAKNQVQKLKQDLKAAHKALANEIGEDVSIQNALSGNGWKGRAQKISSLQLKLAQLSEKLANEQSFQSQSHDVLVNVRQAEKDMRNELAKELKDCKAELEQTKNKFNASKMRCKVLEGDLQSSKAKISSVLEKSNHDDQLIAALTTQATVLKDKYKTDICTSVTMMEKKCLELEEKFQLEKMKTSQLQNMLNKSEDTISHLQEKVNALKKNRAVEKIDVSEMTQTREFGINTAQDLLTQIAEAERARLLELIQVLNKRLETHRDSLNQQEEELRTERQKTAKLETKVARLELLRVNGSCEKMYSSRSSTVNGSCDKMYSSRSATEDNTSEKTQERIELLEEQCATLKTRLRCLSQEKEEDIQSLSNLLDDAKKKFTEALKSKTSAKENQLAISTF